MKKILMVTIIGFLLVVSSGGAPTNPYIGNPICPGPMCDED